MYNCLYNVIHVHPSRAIVYGSTTLLNSLPWRFGGKKNEIEIVPRFLHGSKFGRPAVENEIEIVCSLAHGSKFGRPAVKKRNRNSL